LYLNQLWDMILITSYWKPMGRFEYGSLYRRRRTIKCQTKSEGGWDSWKRLTGKEWNTNNTGPEGGVVPGNPKGRKTVPDDDSVDREEDISPEFMKCFTRLKWECLRTGDSMAVLQYPFSKPLVYKQLKEDLMMHQIVVTISRQKTRHLKKVGKLEPLYAMPLVCVRPPSPVNDLSPHHIFMLIPAAGGS
jgi:hypothetical protein